ncbi:hypothetical protein N9U60_02290 [Betaproteobacteria bacterium]|nr:hypothetical protein [Betaproteobacteria bacterium]
MEKGERRSKLSSLLGELEAIKFSTNRGIFRMDAELIKEVTTLLGYGYRAEGVFQRKHLLKHPDNGIRFFFYEGELLNFLLNAVEEELDK